MSKPFALEELRSERHVGFGMNERVALGEQESVGKNSPALSLENLIQPLRSSGAVGQNQNRHLSCRFVATQPLG